MNEQDLLELKEEIEEAKQKVSELKGEKQALMKRLKEDWDCNSVDEAKTKLAEIEKKIEKITENIEIGCENLSQKF
jgi:predicted nuclease with TOPRIM domain